jgi:hypothetical protein
MNNLDITTIATRINELAIDHPIGGLQKIRKDLKKLRHLPCQTIFGAASIFNDKGYAFHLGGRTELQFNIGFEDPDGKKELRYGVAFSLERGHSLPDISKLTPNIILFNDYLRLYSEEFADMRMWHFLFDERSSDYMPCPIPPKNQTPGIFIFLGKRQPLDNLDYEAILCDLDRLLPLYKYVESDGNLPPTYTPTIKKFEFPSDDSTDYPAIPFTTTATLTQQQIDISLRHNQLQVALLNQLRQEYGKDNVRKEVPSGVGTRIDVVVRQDNDKYWFYEIKNSHSSRACLREAIGQLLEYSHWPGTQEAEYLIVVGETPIDEDGMNYLRKLKERFCLPIEYKHIEI